MPTHPSCRRNPSNSRERADAPARHQHGRRPDRRKLVAVTGGRATSHGRTVGGTPGPLGDAFAALRDRSPIPPGAGRLKSSSYVGPLSRSRSTSVVRPSYGQHGWRSGRTSLRRRCFGGRHDLRRRSPDETELVPPVALEAEARGRPPWRARLRAGGDGLAGTPRGASRRVGAWRRTGVPRSGSARGRTTKVIQLRRATLPVVARLQTGNKDKGKI